MLSPLYSPGSFGPFEFVVQIPSILFGQPFFHCRGKATHQIWYDDRKSTPFTSSSTKDDMSITRRFSHSSYKGLAVFRRLAGKADVVVENFRPDVKARLGIDYDSLRKINPRIVYGSISGFGQDGPYHKRPGFDQIAQGMGGLMSITGAPGHGPMRVGIQSGDAIRKKGAKRGN
jgi:hypothetical protein